MGRTSEIDQQLREEINIEVDNTNWEIRDKYPQ
jgi:hypothetical protein